MTNATGSAGDGTPRFFGAGSRSIPLRIYAMVVDSRGETPPEPAGEDARATSSLGSLWRYVAVGCGSFRGSVIRFSPKTEMRNPNFEKRPK
jgi:hypothetical protein